MSDRPVERIRERLEGVKGTGPGKWSAKCPAHDDSHPSLNIREGHDGRALIHCHAGCSPDSIVVELGLRMSDLFVQEGKPKWAARGEIVGAYHYEDAEGRVLYQSVRVEPGKDGRDKSFFFRRPDGSGGWINNLEGTSRVLYRLSEVLKAVETGTTVYVVEGEKDADNVARLGLCATSNPGGAGKWKTEYSKILKGAKVRIVPDNDGAGRKHATKVEDSLQGVAQSVEIVELPNLDPKGDISDWITQKGSDNLSIDDIAAELESMSGQRVDPSSRNTHRTQSKPGRPSQSAILVEQAGEAEFFHDAEDRAYATLSVDGHRENWLFRAREFRTWLARKFYLQEGKPPGAHALQDALSVLEGQANFDGTCEEVFVRLGESDGRIYLDLGNEAWDAVEIAPDGWDLTGDCPVKFIRPKGLQGLPVPTRGGSIDDLRPFMNLANEDDFMLLVAWLVAAIRPTGPYPVLSITGEQGSTKSTLGRLARSIIDPNLAALRAAPRDGRDLAIAARNGWVIAFDNFSYVRPQLSDALCRLSTGGGFATRRLYTDAEEELFDAQRPVILNGINEVVTRGDLLDRTILLTLPRIPADKRRAERKFWREFEEAKPRILGALLDAVSVGLKNLPDVHLEELPRMADFAEWIVACASALPFSGDEFLSAYARNRRGAIEASLDSDVVAEELLQLGSFGGTASQLLERLGQGVSEEIRRQKSWPKSPSALSGRVRRAAPALRGSGLSIEFEQAGGSNSRKLIRIEPVNADASDAERRSDASEDQTGVGGVDGVGNMGMGSEQHPDEVQL